MAVECLKTMGTLNPMILALADEESDRQVANHIIMLDRMVDDCPVEETVIGDLYLKVLAYKAKLQ
jgi:hypothetical protein